MDEESRQSLTSARTYMDIAVVVLNYLAVQETAEFLCSIEDLFPGIRIVVVDNGSPEPLRNDLLATVKKFPNVTLEALHENLGFARGMNHGIRVARNEGFKYVAVSNNDVLFPDPSLFRVLLDAEAQTGCAVVGPDIRTPVGTHQNPFFVSRPAREEALRILESVAYPKIARTLLFQWLKKVLPEPVVKILKKFRKESAQSPFAHTVNVSAGLSPVYALHGAFLMFCPAFFNHYEGFWEETFLYMEELILAEMLHRKGLNAIYAPTVSLFHKEDATSNLVWGGQTRLVPLLHARKSTLLWFRKFYSASP